METFYELSLFILYSVIIFTYPVDGGLSDSSENIVKYNLFMDIMLFDCQILNIIFRIPYIELYWDDKDKIVNVLGITEKNVR